MIELTDIYEKNDIKSSAYYDSLNQSINYIEGLNEILEQRLLVNNKNRKKFRSFIDTKNITIVASISLISNSLPLLFKVNALSIMLPSIISYILFLATNCRKYKLKDELIKTKITTLENIYNYLKTEQEITKDMKYLLSSNIIYQLDDLFQKDMKTVMNAKRQKSSYLQSINYKYENGYKNNLSILDTIDSLNNEQKEKYLVGIYSKINSCINYSDGNMINIINKDFTLIDNSSTLLIENNTVDDDNTTGESTNTKASSNIKPISLKKDAYFPYYKKNDIIYKYGDPMPPLFQEENGKNFQDVNAINTPNELNSIFTYQQGEDILPPKVQEKGHQLCKKLPK